MPRVFRIWIIKLLPREVKPVYASIRACDNCGFSLFICLFYNCGVFIITQMPKEREELSEFRPELAHCRLPGPGPRQAALRTWHLSVAPHRHPDIKFRLFSVALAPCDSCRPLPASAPLFPCVSDWTPPYPLLAFLCLPFVPAVPALKMPFLLSLPPPSPSTPWSQVPFSMKSSYSPSDLNPLCVCVPLPLYLSHRPPSVEGSCGGPRSNCY